MCRRKLKNDGKENRSEKTRVGKGQGKKVMHINISKTRKSLTMKIAFEGYANLYAKVTSRIIQKECTGANLAENPRHEFPDKVVSTLKMQRHFAKGNGGVTPPPKGGYSISCKISRMHSQSRSLRSVVSKSWCIRRLYQ